MVERFFVSPVLPPVGLVAEWIVGRFGERARKNFSNFGGVLVLCPTRFACLNVRIRASEKYAQRFGVGGEAAFTGISFKTLEDVLAELTGSVKRMNSEERAAAWLRTFSEVESPAFPVPSRSEALEASRRFGELSRSLSENALTVGEAAEILSKKRDGELSEFLENFEIERWGELAKIEEKFFEVAGEFGAVPGEVALSEALKNLNLKNISEVVLAGNFGGLANKFLRSVLKSSPRVKISVIVFSDESDKEAFGEFGEAVPEIWENRLAPAVEEFSFAETESEARQAASLAASYKPFAADSIGVSCAQDPKTVGIFKSSFESQGILARLPEADTLEKTSLRNFVYLISEYSENPTLSALSAVLVNPYSRKFFQNELGMEVDAICEECDRALDEVVPIAAADAVGSSKSFPLLSEALEVFKGEFFVGGGACAALKFFGNFAELASDFNSDSESKAAETLLRSLENASEAELKMGGKFSKEEIFSLLFEAFSSEKKDFEYDPGSVPLLDWMEIFWSEAPHILLCDFNEGVVPELACSGEFLNESIRSRLGLRTRASRRARDAYMLEVLARSRSSNGRALTIFIPRKNSSGDPVFASGLLFKVPDSNLPSKVKSALLDTVDVPQPIPEGELPKIDIPIGECSFGKFSASELNAYLSSPWEFYLRYVLKARPFDAGKSELDAGQIGSVFHKVFFRFAKSISSEKDSQRIFRFLLSELNRIMAEKFGENARAQIRLQTEGIIGRLKAASKVQSAWASSGWRIMTEFCEAPFETEVCGEKIVGVFDRIDEHGDEIFVLDYKTFDKAESAKSKHVKTRRNGEEEWLNFQLPIYFKAASEIFPGRKIRCGYFSCPKNVSETKIDEWSDISDFERSAEEEISRVIGRIRRGEFKPEKLSPFNPYDYVFGLSRSELLNSLNFVEAKYE